MIASRHEYAAMWLDARRARTWRARLGVALRVLVGTRGERLTASGVTDRA